MKLTKEQKTAEKLDRVWEICKASFTGICVPDPRLFITKFMEGDVFLLYAKERNPFSDYVVVGYALVDSNGPNPYVFSLAVDPTQRGRGFGKLLLDDIARAYPASEIDLAVMVDNVAAQVLYLKNGFRVVRFLKDYYGPEGDGLLMRRII